MGYCTVTHELSQSNPLSNQLTPWPSYIQQPKIDPQIATLEILRWNKKSKSFIFWNPRGNKSSIRFYLISLGVLDFHHCFPFLSDFRRVESARKHRRIARSSKKFMGLSKYGCPKTHCIVMIIMCLHFKCLFWHLPYFQIDDLWNENLWLSNHSQKSSHVQVFSTNSTCHPEINFWFQACIQCSVHLRLGEPHWLLWLKIYEFQGSTEGARGRRLRLTWV